MSIYFAVPNSSQSLSRFKSPVLLGAWLLLSILATAQVIANPPYTVSVFAQSVPGSYTQPDSIAVGRHHIFIGYGNGVAPDGSDGKSSTIVEYRMDGTVVQTFTIKGHNDGLKIDPESGLLWAMQNEDGNPNLAIINPKTGHKVIYTFGPTPHGGGYDDIVFRDDKVYFSASNPSNNPNTGPAIVRAHFVGHMVMVTPVLAGNSNATDIPTDTLVQLNLQDPDSMILDPFGDIVLDSQADSELIVVHKAGSDDQSVFHLPITQNGVAVQIDDTIFARSTFGLILVSDRDGETVYSIQKSIFAPTQAYSAAPSFVGELDMNTGVLTSAVTGFVNAHGMAFVSK